MNCTPIWPEHVDRQRQQRRRQLDMAINRLKTNLELIINAGSAKSDLLGSDQIGAEWSGAGRHQLVGGLPNAAAAAATHLLARGRGSGSCLTGWRSWMKAKTRTQSCGRSRKLKAALSMSESEFESEFESEYVIRICFLCLFFFLFYILFVALAIWRFAKCETNLSAWQ